MSIFAITYCIWFLAEVLLNRLLRSGKADKQQEDRHSLLIIWITIAVSAFLAPIIAGNTHYPIAASTTLPYTGLALIILGVCLRLLVIHSLGRYFTVDVTIRESHRLKRDGVYHFLRHPSYAASLLSFIGFGISLNNWLSLCIVVVPVLAAFLYRIKVEEKALVAHFGAEYLDYKKSTKALVPYIF